MSLLGGILGNVVGSVFGGHPRGGPQHNSLGAILSEAGGDSPIQRGMLLGAALKLVQQQGGLDGVLDRLRQCGLGAQADSWVGTGPNLPISPEELQRALGATSVDHLAAPLDLTMEQAGSALSQILPELVHQLTPNGELPPNHADLVARGIAMLHHAGA